MDKSLTWRFLLLLVVVIVSGFYLVPSFVKLPSWWEATFPSEKISLGLDLQGGMHLMLEVETEKALSNSVDRTVSDLNDLLFNEKIPVDKIERAGSDKLTLELLNTSYQDKLNKLLKERFTSLDKLRYHKVIIMTDADRAVPAGGVAVAMTVIEALQSCSLFKEFTETGLKIFSAIATEKSVPAGCPLFVVNMVEESLFIVKAGQVRLSLRDGGQERELAVLGPGEHLGALGLLAKCVRLVSAVAAAGCEVVEIAQRDYYRLQPQKPQACLKLALAIAADLAQQANDSRDALRSLAVAGKG